ncbi:MAG TPA: asparagine synthase-related protein [Chitinispirillaceae bacterium]|nr:asparagine synthase-related protein [Chitinispirillaceae bacterium]
MPGIFGFVTFKSEYANDETVLTKMCQLHSLLPSFQKYTHRKNDCHVGYSQPKQIFSQSQYFASKNNVTVFLDGELYNQDKLPVKLDEEKGVDASVILENYQADNSLKFLRSVDGVYTAVIHDEKKELIVLITDRYGLQHLHWTQNENVFAWASEYKAFTEIPSFKCDINTSSMDDFFKYGYILESKTWLNNVHLLSPATILTFDIRSKKTETRKYWSWNEIKINNSIVDEIECAREWGRLFANSLKRRIYPHKRIGITLSGGLDSRAILAAIPSIDDVLHTFTFGVGGCDDIRIASKAAHIKGTEHHNCYLDISKWLEKNIEAVWASDGDVSLLDTNGNEYLPFIAEHIDVCLNGIGGDALHGGSFLSMSDRGFYESDDPYGSRGRRYIRQGFRYDQSFYHIRCPFYDNKLLEFQLSLPEQVRKKSYIYNKELLYNYPTFFKAIPWQKTGVPISYPAFYGKVLSTGKKAISHFIRTAEQMGFPVKDTRNYVNHLQRTLNNPGRVFLDDLFKNQNAIYPQFLKREDVLSVWKNHINGKCNVSLVNRYATFEIWLQQIFEKKYRP